jgi:hypothetical protein
MKIIASLVVLCTCVAIASVACAGQHRSHAVLNEFQREHPCPSTGLTHGACPGWIKDHWCPLECGGPDAVSNLVWQTVRDAKAKDRWELMCWTCK